jgi:hypothetical protein
MLSEEEMEIGRAVVRGEIPLTASNAPAYSAAFQEALDPAEASAARAQRIYAARMAKLHVDEAMRFLPMLGAVIGVPPHITAAITRGLESAGKLVGLTPEVLDAVKNVTDE